MGDDDAGSLDRRLAQERQSSTNGCVEVAFVQGRVAVRDSKDRTGSVLVFTAHEWEAFLRGVRAGEFNQGVRAGEFNQRG